MMTATLCEVCGITEEDIGTGSNKWYTRHSRVKALPACKQALDALNMYERARRNRNQNSKRIGWGHLDYIAPLDSLCDVCHITPKDTHGHRWYQRHVTKSSAPCIHSKKARSRATTAYRIKSSIRNDFLLSHEIELYKKQKGRCAGCNTFFRPRHMDVYKKRPTHKFIDKIDELHLLCNFCHKTKGNRSIAYLQDQLQIVDKLEQEYYR